MVTFVTSPGIDKKESLSLLKEEESLLPISPPSGDSLEGVLLFA